VIGQPDLIPPYPTITRLELPTRQPSLEFREGIIGAGETTIVGDELDIHGHHLAGHEILVHFIHPRLAGAEAAQFKDVTATKITVKLSETEDVFTRFPAGLYRLAVVVTKTEEGETVTRTTNQLPVSLAPRVTVPADPVGPDPADDDKVILTLECKPHVWPEQRVVVLLGSSEVPARSHPDKTGSLTFDITGIPFGEYLVRLRVDGVDSLPVQDYAATPLTFDEKQKVTIPEHD
jgi:hypothetical protein